MLENQDILCIGSQDWHTHMCVPQQTMLKLAKSNRVIYVDDTRTILRLKYKYGGNNNDGSGLRKIGDKDTSLYKYSPPPVFLTSNIFPATLSKITSNINGYILTCLLKNIMSTLNFTEPILWIYSPYASCLPRKIKSKMVIYDCIDEWSGYISNRNQRENIIRKDRELCQGVDIVFVGSKGLLESKRRYNEKTYFVPHAADFNHFTKASLEETKSPDDISKIKKPLIGLIGVLEKRVDMKILRHLAVAHPEWSLVLIGPVLKSLDISPIRELPNVHFLGMKEVDHLPNYLKALDVCIIPYIIDDFTRNIYPLKLHEYLASGKPIVTTRIPACEEYGEVIKIADTPEEFDASVSAALEEKNIQKVQKRIKIAGENSWDNRVERKSELIEAILKR